MRNKIIFIFMLLICNILFAEKPVINWHKTELPPLYIKEGELKEKGVGDIIQKIFYEEFSDYNNIVTYANLKRTFEDSKKYENFIVLALKNKTREKEMIISYPVTVVLSAKVIYRSEDKVKFKEYINKEGNIDLEKVILDKKIRIGISVGRIFAEKVNQIIDENLNNKNIEILMSQNSPEGNIEKLTRKRVDCIIEYLEVLEYYKKDKRIEYEAITIKDVPEYFYLFIILNKNEFGENAVKRINKVLETKIYDEKYIDISARWYKDKKAYKEIYIKAMNKYFEDEKTKNIK